MDIPNEKIIVHTRRWIEHLVIGQNLCPFAKVPFGKGTIRFQVVASTNEDELAQALLGAMAYLYEQPPSEVETTLLIHPNCLTDFEAYLDFLAVADYLLVEAGLEGILQIASFHPDYQFEDTDPDDPANYSNRSPYPMLHLLREESVTQAVALHPDAEGIPARNIARLRELGGEVLQTLIEEIKK